MLADEIKEFFHGDVEDDDATLAKFSRDYSIFKVTPKVVVFPKDVDDLKNLVKFVAKKKAAGEDISLTGRSAGTDMTGGPLSQSIIVSFTKYFNHIKEIVGDVNRPSTSSGQAPSAPSTSSGQAGSGNNVSYSLSEAPFLWGGVEGQAFATVEPGVYFRDFEKELTARGLLYPPYPASKDLCALGGMIMNNSGGEKTLAYGKTEDYVEEISLVMGDGEEHVIGPLHGDAELAAKLAEPGFEGDAYRKMHALLDAHYDEIKKAKPDVLKNSAGYYLWNIWDKEKKVFDLTKLVVGSQGTLGLVAGAKLRLVPMRKCSQLVVVFLKELTWAGDLVDEVLKFKPESIESYDDKTLGFAVRLWRQVLGSMKGNVLTLGWQFLPEVWMVLRGGMPKMIMLIELTSDSQADLDAQLQKLKASVETFRGAHSGIQVRVLRDAAEAEKYWTIRRESFALLHDNTTGKDTAPFIDDFIVKPEYVPEFLPKVNAILDKYKKDLIYTIAGHPGNGNYHIIPLMDLADPRVRALIPVISEEVYKLVLEYHGSITAEHNDGLIRTPYLEEMYGPAITALFAETKKIFDPLNIFNPGKKVDGSLKYSEEHISSSK